MEKVSRRLIVFGMLLTVIILAAAGAYVVGDDRSAVAKDVQVTQMQDEAESYMNVRVRTTGWYEGGTLRDANPMCTTGRDGRPIAEYGWVFMSTEGIGPLYIGQEYEVTGRMVDGVDAGRPIVGGSPILIPESVRPINSSGGSCN
jgi:hypothetical protein